MAFLDNISKRVSDFGQEVSAKTRTMADISRLNSAITEQERQIETAFSNIGKAYYARHKDDPCAEEMESITYINEAYVRIQQYKTQISQLKGIANCPSCGSEISSVASFCSFCGSATGFAPPTRPCPGCGAQMDISSSFCTSCGTRLTRIHTQAQESQSAQEPPQSQQRSSPEPVIPPNQMRESAQPPVQPSPQAPVTFEPVPTTPQTYACPNCNSPIEPGDTFCTNCGMRIGSN